MRVMRQQDRSGFTLVETILASVILCASILALGAISTRSLGAAKLNRQYEVAMALVDRQLTWIDYIGIEDFIALDEEYEGFVVEISLNYTKLLTINNVYHYVPNKKILSTNIINYNSKIIGKPESKNMSYVAGNGLGGQWPVVALGVSFLVPPFFLL